MPDFFLDLKDATQVVDFLVEHTAYAGPKARTAADDMAKDYHDLKKIPREKMAETAKKLAVSAWPARTAVEYFLTHEGAEEEWSRVTSAVRPSTAHLLKRFRKGVGVKSLDEALRHDEAATAFREEELREIEEVRVHLRQDFWKEKSAVLAVLVKSREEELAGYQKRFATLRDLAAALPSALQDEIFSKVAHYEDRILFKAEIIPFEILDHEISYYTEQKEISIE